MGKTAIVIGGLKGIGRAISQDLVHHGFTVYATTREEVADTGSEHLIPLQLDVTSEEDVEIAMNQIGKDRLSLDVLVNNAGVGVFKAFEEITTQEWENVFKTNVLGILQCTQKAFPLLRQRGGRIINVSSIATERKLPFNTVYAASKHALRGFGGVLGEEWAPYHIFTTNLHLGATYTDIWKDAEGFSAEDMLHVDDVARVVSFIATTPLHVRIDDITVTPPKGVL
ncbi:SDR family oxidoreductase [Ammoniphilus sp. YIM 78166]|uniref:SDR family oxidoreductase n=1 Tax=Ammoniphilus sp. YIM 78166 TaxID=1644106 RepID=UPI0014322344|nr:SDR family NAD(P)-dependent oxidoreductase [Ammoniphilus sp. YIM 78166]